MASCFTKPSRMMGGKGVLSTSETAHFTSDIAPKFRKQFISCRLQLTSCRLPFREASDVGMSEG